MPHVKQRNGVLVANGESDKNFGILAYSSLRELEGKQRESLPNVLLLVFFIWTWNVLGVWVSHVIYVMYSEKRATACCVLVLNSCMSLYLITHVTPYNALLVRLRASCTRYPRRKPTRQTTGTCALTFPSIETS